MSLANRNANVADSIIRRHEVELQSSAGSTPVQGILFINRLVWEDGGAHFEATSLPGHLLHYVVSGHVQQECNGRRYELRPGVLLWYHGDELVRGTVLEAPWIFYSVNFIAPTLPPPGFEARLYHPPPETKRQFELLFETWNDSHLAPAARLFRLHARLLDILAELATPEQHAVSIDSPARLWWSLESELRRDLSRPINIETLQNLAHCSAATIARSCHSAVGLAPMQRVKQIRLSLAHGLVLRSTLNISEIARQVGYGRVHEFSRDYKRRFGTPPTEERRKSLQAETTDRQIAST